MKRWMVPCLLPVVLALISCSKKSEKSKSDKKDIKDRPAAGTEARPETPRKDPRPTGVFARPTLTLRKDSITLDMVGWGEANNGFFEGLPAPAPGPNESISRYGDGVDTQHNNLDFAITAPTPGFANPKPEPQ